MSTASSESAPDSAAVNVPVGTVPSSSPAAVASDSLVDESARPKIQVGKSTLGARPSQPGYGSGPRGAHNPPRGPNAKKPQKARPPRDGESSDGVRQVDENKLFDNEPKRGHIPVPSKRDKFTAEMEAELNEALGDLSLDQIVQDGVASRALQVVENEAKLRGTVVRLAGDHVFISMGGRNEGVVSVRSFKEPPVLGTEMDVVVRSFNADDGLYELLVPGASIDVSDWSDLAQGAIVDARVTGANTGGLECLVNKIRGFIPASQVSLFRIENFADFLNQVLPCVVTEVNPQRKNLVLSHRALLEREKEESKKKLLAELEVGQIRDGVVRSIQDFGCFVDLGGVDGLIHVSRLSWDRIKHPRDVVKEGQRVRVKVERLDEQTGKISLSYRDLLERPWDTVQEKFVVGSTAKGPVTRIANFGAFVKLAPGVEGLIHISELAHGRVRRVEDVMKEGQEVEVKILSVDTESQRIGLSFKATLPPPEAAAVKEEPDEPLRPLSVKPQNRPLRGGTERSTGGEKLGLNW